MNLISFAEYKKQIKVAEKLHNKFEKGKLTEKDRQEWLKLDLKVKQAVSNA